MRPRLRDHSSRILSTVLVVAMVHAPLVAWAQPAKKPAAPAAAPPRPAPPAPPAPPATKSLADTLEGEAKTGYESGKLLFGDGDFAGALLKFQHAFDLSKDVRLLWNMAACEKSLRHYARAVSLVDRYLIEGHDKLTADDEADAKRLRDAIVEFTAPLTITVSEAGADVVLDDETVGQSPLPAALTVDIGSHKVTIRKAGFKEFTSTSVVGGTNNPPVVAKLEPDVHQGKLIVKAQANASITIDGTAVGLGDWTGMLQSGGHTLKVLAPKMRVYQTEVTLVDDQTRNVEVSLEPETSHGGIPVWIWVAGGVVVAGAVVGIAFAVRPTDTSPVTKGTVGTIDLP
jgi:hypothetical protein